MPVTPVATEGHAEACSLGYHLRAAMLVSEDRATAGAILTWMAGAVMCGHGDIQARTAAYDYVWVHGPAATGVCDDVGGLC